MAEIYKTALSAEFMEIKLPKYDGTLFGMGDFSEGMAAVSTSDKGSRQSKYGFIDKAGNEVVTPEFVSAGDFSEGFAAVSVETKKGEKTGLIDKAGRMAVPPIYDYIGRLTDGMARFCIKENGELEWDFPINKWGFIKMKHI